MGSLLPEPSQADPPPPIHDDRSLSNYRVFAPFCLRDPGLNTTISNWIECYNPSTNTWSHATSIPDLPESHVLKGFAMISLGNSIYIIGGRLCHKEKAKSCFELDDFVDVGISVRSTVIRYNVLSNQWSECAPLGIPRYNFACTICDQKIFVAGGQSTLSGARGVSASEAYDPELDKWTPLPNMSTKRCKCVGVTWQDKIHVVGGFAEKGDSDKTLPFVWERSSAEVYDAQAEKWELVAGMWQLDVPPNQIVDVDEKLYSSGDCLKAWKGHIETFDGKLKIWNEVRGSARINLDYSPASTSDTGEETWPQVKLLYLTMAPIGTHLYFLAGYRTSGELARMRTTVHVFDTLASDAAWRNFEPEEEEGEKELCSHCCVVQFS